MSHPRPIEPYNFQANLNWWDGPFTYRAAPLPLATRRVTYLTNRKQGLEGNSASQKSGWPESERATIGKYTWKLEAGEC